MSNISIPIPDTFQQDFTAMLTIAAREAIATAKQQELNHGKDFMSISECCQYMNVSYNTLVGVWVKQLNLKTIVVQGKIFISKQTLLEFLKSHEI